MAKISVNGLYKIFGPHSEKALAALRQGRSKEEIFERIGSSVAVQNATFDVEAGEIFVIMGLSGSGKSTLVRMFNRLIEPTTGSILVDGRDIAKLSRRDLIALRRRDMSMVFQSFALMPHLTVWQNAAFGLEIAGIDTKERREKAQHALEAVGLGAYAESRPSELSGGMQQRVGLARALANDPSVLLMDEAFSALDPLIRTEMQDELLRLEAGQQKTIVFISHDLDEAVRIGDRVAIMEGGRVVQVGRPDEILKGPVNDYVRSFFRNIDVTKVLTAGDVARRDQVTLVRHSGEGIRAALRRLREWDQEYGYVHDRLRRFHGVVSAQSLSILLARKLENPGLDAAFLPDLPAIESTTPLDQVLPRLAKSPCPLPVVDRDGIYVGVVSKTAYLETLSWMN